MLQAKKNTGKKIEATPMHVKTGDTVMVISGKDKGKTGVVRKVLREKSRVIVEGVNKIKKAVRPNPMAGIQGGIVEMEAPLHSSKVMLFDHQVEKATRVKHKVLANGKKVRVSAKSDLQFDS